VRREANGHGLRYRGEQLAFEILPPVATDKGEGIRQLIDRPGLKAVICFIDDISEMACLMFSRLVAGRPWRS
jgi:hypothetical protein